MLRIVTDGFPQQQVRMLGETTHLAEIAADPGGCDSGKVSFQPIQISPLFRGSPQIVSLARLGAEWAMLRRALAQVPRGEPCLLIMLSTTATSLFVASWLLRLRGKATGALIVMHGNLNEVVGWRPRNPLARALDLRSGLLGRHPDRLRFLVLEPGIKDELARCLPGAAVRTVVLPHPVNATVIAAYPALPLCEPIRIGLVGQATRAKGIETFLQTAVRMRARHAGRVEFHLVGQVPPGEDLAPYSVLASAASHAPLPRADFAARLAQLHYVMFALGTGYYNLAASGAVIDAITALKPLLATPIPIVDALFAAFGDIGHVAAGPNAIDAEIEAILQRMDTGRYDAQVAALARLRDSRLPAALVPRLRAIVRELLPGRFGSEAETNAPCESRS